MLTLAGYEVSTVLHEGAFSRVYRGHHRADGKTVVLKTLRQSIPDPEQLARYQQEYTITHALGEIPGVIRVHELAWLAHCPVIVLEDYGAQTLTEYLKTQPLPLDTFLELAIALTRILAAVHQAQVIHKDINPANVLIHPQSREIKLIDFGIASQLSRETPMVSGVGVLEGTLPYLSPEQTGRMNRALDYRSDFYSLGATFFEMLTGRPPFQFQDPLELIHAHIARQPPQVSDLSPAVPPTIAAIVDKLLAKTAEDRYQSGWGLLRDLQRCQTQWQQTGAIAPFPLAQRDVSDRFQICQKLYGRQQEVAQIRAAFERISGDPAHPEAPGGRELLLVAGYSGIGKSALVREVYQPITGRRGYLIGGKFDPLQRNVPYWAFIAAFSDLVSQLLTESDEQLARWRSRLQETLGANLPVMVALVPQLALVVGEQPAPISVQGTEAQNRFNVAIQTFVRVFAQPQHPLVIFLDDLQWADLASLKLLQRLLETPEGDSLLLIGAYRDNEVTATHPLTLTLEQLQGAGGRCTTLTLTALGLPDITQLVADTLHHPPARVQELGELLQAKTGGNPFFMGEFLKTLHRDRLITFDPQAGQWCWDLTAIHQRNVTDNLVDLLADSIQQLPKDSQRVLQYAACMGTPFDLYSLARVLGHPPETIAQQLWPALAAELVLPVGDTYRLTSAAISRDRPLQYRFAHDRIQQAAYAGLAVADRPQVHYCVGQRLLELASQAMETSWLFQIVNQLNLGLGQAQRDGQTLILAGLNLRAGRQAKAAAAYDTALTYLQTGLDLLGDRAWSTQPQLTLELHQEAAEVACLCGQYPLMTQLCATALAHTHHLADQLPLHLTQIQATILQNQPQQAVAQTLPLLRSLGMGFPARFRMGFVIGGLMWTRLRLTRWSDDALRSQPMMSDSRRLAAMDLLERIGTSAYVALPDLSPLITFKILAWSLRYGYSAPTPMAFASYGLVMAGIMGDINAGYRYGQIARQVAQRYDAPNIRCRTQFLCNYLIDHWKEPLPAIAPRMEEVYQLGLEAGDLEYAAFALYTAVQLRLLAGTPLGEVQPRLADSAETIERLQQQTALKWVRLTQQMIATLTEVPPDLSAPRVQVVLPDLGAGRDRTGIFLACTYRLRLYYLLGQPQQALVEAAQAKPYEDAAVSAPTMTLHLLYTTLSQLAHWPQMGQRQRRQVARQIHQVRRKFKGWAHHSPVNYSAARWLIEGEWARCQGQITTALQALQQALQAAQTHRRLPDEALAHQCLGSLYVQMDQTVAATAHLSRAYLCYQLWGATALAALLRYRYPQWVEVHSEGSSGTTRRVTTQQTTGTSSGRLTEALDFSSVMKASEAIASEIMLDRLVKRLMEILLESAGAQSGVLLLNQEGTLVVAARGTLAAGGTEIMAAAGQATPQPVAVDWSEAIVNYVMRTRQSLVLGHASEDDRFSQDAYVRRHHPQSVLCAPLKNQGRLSGLVYLENNLVPNAFTPDRLEVLNLLSAQAAIALDNARLYTNLADLNAAYARFVPRQFLQHLNKRSITEVHLGDQVQVEMSVMFADIRAFTTLSETLTPQANFAFINDYLACMEPIIVEHGGFIDKYIGDAIMALFSGAVDDAVGGAIAMQQALEAYNDRRQQQGLSPIRIGIGINTGTLMLGTVGGPNRMDSTVISDAVNLTARLEELTKTYGVSLLISHHTYSQLRYPQHHCIRNIGRVTVKGKTQAITIYEVFDGDPAPLKQAKLATLEAFQAGVEAYQHRQPVAARHHFEHCAAIAPLDTVVAHYLHQLAAPEPPTSANPLASSPSAELEADISAL
jgi:predicted ATPase/class 3 adenylate cyclase/tRNA A-37 threonylcarbamoyl transferase component Bud32